MSDLKLFNLDYFRELYNSSIFIETGLGMGHGLLYASRYMFDKLFSIEIEEDVIRKVNQYIVPQIYRNERVSIIHGNTMHILPKILACIPGNISIIFWLDAHLGSYGATDANTLFPLENEINIINTYRSKSQDIIIIDDLRLYKDGDYQYGSITDSKIFRHNNKIDKAFLYHDIYKCDLGTGYLICLPRNK